MLPILRLGEKGLVRRKEVVERRTRKGTADFISQRWLQQYILAQVSFCNVTLPFPEQEEKSVSLPSWIWVGLGTAFTNRILWKGHNDSSAMSLNWPASFYFLLLRMFTWGKPRSHIISPIIASYKEAWATHIKRLCGEMPSYMSNPVGPSDDSRPCSHLTTTAYTENCFTEPSQPTEWWDIMKNHLIFLGSGLVYQMATDTWNGGRKKNREWFRAIIALLHININWTCHSELRDLH